MKPRLSLLALMLLCLITLLALPPATLRAEGAPGREEAEKVRWVVGLYDGGAAPALAAAADAAVVLQDAALDFIILETTGAKSRQVQQELQRLPQVRYVEQDAVASAAFTPNDPAFNDPTKVYAPQQIGAPGAWDSTTGAGVIIAILDTGIDFTHPEFAGRLVAGWDFVQQDADPSDDHGHGTHVAGIAGAAIDNGIGIAGMAGSAQIMPIKVLDASANGWWSAVAAGIHWAVDQGAQVINLSLSGSISSQALVDAIAYAHDHDVVVVSAAGNENTAAPRYPASLNHVLSAGATTSSGQRWTLSNFGGNLDVMAPGATVYSTAWQASIPAGYRFMSGTSMAAPHVAGLAALLLSLDPTLTPDAIADTLMQTSQDMGDPGFDAYTGAGLINAAAAVATLLPPPPCVTGLEGLVYRDFDGDGLRDAGEPGWSGLQAALVSAGDRQIVAQAETDAAGIYHFSDVPPGAYLIDIDQQPAWLAGYGLTTANEPLPAQAIDCATLTLPAIGFGPQPDTRSILGGRVRITAAAQDGAYRQVTLRDRTGAHDLGTIETDAFGLYRFDLLSAGIYIVGAATAPLAGAFGELSRAAANQPLAGEAAITVVRLGHNEANFSVDISAAGANAIGGALYLDSNGNGRPDAAETQAVSSGVITLTHLSTLQTLHTLSDSAGNYLFTDLEAGAYRLSLPRTLPGLALTSANELEVTVTEGDVYASADFGYIAPAAVTLSDFTAQPAAQGIMITWSTSSEDEHSSFRIWRAATPGGKYKPVSEVILAFGYRTGASYKWLDRAASSGNTFSYQLQSLPDGVFYGPITPGADANAFASKVFIPFLQR